MPKRDQDWLNQAGRDLRRAKSQIQHEFFEWSCFISHQAAEKAIRSLRTAISRLKREIQTGIQPIYLSRPIF